MKLSSLALAAVLALTPLGVVAQTYPVNQSVPPCSRQDYTPVDQSGAGLTITIDNTTGSGVNNSSYCLLPGGLVYFQALIIMPVTTDTHQVKLSTPVVGPLYDMPIAVLTLGPCSVTTLFADVTPGHYVKFFGQGQPAALTYAQLSGCGIAYGGVYYGF